MKARRLTLLFLMYVSLDLSCPFVPGAFNFNPDESIEGIARHRENATQRLAAARTPPMPPRLTSPPGARPGGGALRPPSPSRVVHEWLVAVRLAHAPVPEASSPTEEH